MKKTGKRQNGIDLLRILAAVLICFHHHALWTGRAYSPIDYGDGPFYFGLFVELFFMISGYFMCRKEKDIDERKESFFSLYFKRMARMAPSVLACAVFFTIFARKGQGGIGSIILTTLLIQEPAKMLGYPELYLNDHLWFLGVLLFCTLLYYTIVYFCPRRCRRAVFLSLILIGCLLAGQMPFREGFPCSDWGRGLNSFFTGVLVQKMKRSEKTNLYAGASLAGGFAAMLLCLGFAPLISQYMTVFVIFPSLIVLASSLPVRIPLITVLSECTYGVYLWHYPIFDTIRPLLEKAGTNLQAKRVMILMTMVMFVIGYASYRLIEKPCERYLLSHRKQIRAFFIRQEV